MGLELMRLVSGLLIALFHKQIADWILHQEEVLLATARSRGVPYPMPPRRETAYTIYFLMGMSVAIVQLFRIWTLIH
jgi:hypothetical protein